MEVTVAGVRQYLAEHGVALTAQTIANYAKIDGMPHRTGEGGVRFYDAEKVLAWIRANKPAAMRAPGEGGIGGRRAGAGRKGAARIIAEQTPGLHNARPAPAIAGDGGDGRRDGAGSAGSAGGAGGAGGAGDGSGGGGAEAGGRIDLDAALQPVTVGPDGSITGGMTKIEAERRQAVLAAAQRQMELDEQRGLLLPREDVVSAWADQLNALRLALETSATHLQTALARRLGLSVVQGAAIREVLDEHLRGLMESLADDPLGDRQRAA